MSYWKIIAWLLSEAYRIAPSRFAACIGSQFIAALAELGVGGTLFFAFQSFTQLDSQSGFSKPTLLAFLLLTVGSLLALNGGLRFYVERQISLIFSAFETSIVRRVMNKIRCMTLQDMLSNNFVPTRQSTIRSVQMDARFCGMALRSLIRSIVPTVFFFGASAFLVWYDSLVALVLGGCVLLFLPVIYVLNQRAVVVSDEFEKATRDVVGLKGRMVDDLRNGNGSQIQDGEPHHHLLQPAYTDYMDLLRERLMFTSQSNVLNSTFAAFTSMAVLAAFGWQALEGQRQWSEIIFVFLAVRFILGSVRQISGLFTALNRFFAQVSRQYFLLNLKSGSPLQPQKEFVANQFEAGLLDPGDLMIGPGTRHYLIAGLPASQRAVQEELAVLGLVKGGPGADVVLNVVALWEQNFVSEQELDREPIADVEALVALIEGDPLPPAKVTNDEERKALRLYRNRARLGGWKEDAAWSNDFRQWLSRFCTAALQPDVRFLVVDLAALDRMRADQAKRFLGAFPRSTLLVRCQRFVRSISRLPLEDALFVLNDELVAVGKMDKIGEGRQYFSSLTKRYRKQSDDNSEAEII